MCTVTVIPIAGGIRLACNRDESRERAVALPPMLHSVADRRAVFPVDPDSGGTWIGANDKGLVLTLLNANPAEQPTAAQIHESRGKLIPDLLAFETLEAICEEMRAYDAHAYPPFRLLVFSSHSYVEFNSEGTAISQSEPAAVNSALMFTSSGLGDHLVEPPRRALFDEKFVDGKGDVETQNAFHHHQWPDRTHLSVLMSRPDACTVSHTTVEKNEHEAVMTYQTIGGFSGFDICKLIVGG